ncbi:MAG: sterol desaturase family protein [Hyphomonadaceae bacterium]
MAVADFALFGLPEPALRAGVFAGVLVVLLCAERIWPRRRRVAATTARWFTNMALVLIDTGAARLLSAALPAAAAAAAAVWAARHGVGLFNLFQLPPAIAFVTSLFALDFAIWLQHVVFHHVPLFWRMHRVHHADRDLDATSALRFHPFEIVISAFYKAAVAVALGAPATAVIAFEIILNACAMFNHANIALPPPADAVLRSVLVTPDMHRVHHSVHRDEHDSNFGFCLSIWDRLFGAYRAQPRSGHDGMTVGLTGHQDEKPAQLVWSLAFPFLH